MSNISFEADEANSSADLLCSHPLTTSISSLGACEQNSAVHRFFFFIFGALQHSGMYGSTAASSQEQLRQEARLLVSKFAIANGYRCHSHCPIKIGSRT